MCLFSILVRPLTFTQEMGSCSSMDCTLIWTFTTLSGVIPAGGHSGLSGLSPGNLRPMHPFSHPTRTLAKVLPRRCLWKKSLLHLCFCSILDILKGEARILEGLHSLGIKGEHQANLLKLPVSNMEDSYALDIRHPAIMVSWVRFFDWWFKWMYLKPLFLPSFTSSCNFQWMNDIENDPAYRSWPSGVQELLRATFPGVIRQIRRNFFNLVSSPISTSIKSVVIGCRVIMSWVCFPFLLHLCMWLTLISCFIVPLCALLGVVPWSCERRKCWTDKTSRTLLQTQNPFEVGAIASLVIYFLQYLSSNMPHSTCK